MKERENLEKMFITHASILNYCFIEIRKNGAIKENTFQTVVDSFNKLQKKYKEISHLKHDISDKIIVADFFGSYEGWQLKEFKDKESLIDYILNTSDSQKKRIFKELFIKIDDK